MRVGLIGKITKIRDEGIIRELSCALTQRGHTVTLIPSNAEIRDVECLVVLGGDGAILHAATVAAPQGIPLIGVNYGNLGFLTEFEKEEVKSVLTLVDLFAEKKCKILNRSLLEITIGKDTYFALNEVAIQRDYASSLSRNPQILKLKVSTESGTVEIAGDGVLLTTPTGSTAYSLSAGGAIIAPEVPVFMLTPICAFTMGARPMVFSEEEVFQFSIEKGRALLLIDGKAVATLAENDRVSVKKAPFYASFPTINEKNFFKKIKNKLNG